MQTLGWGNYLIERNGQQPVLWQAATVSPLLSRGYTLLTSEKRPSTTTSPAWSYERECENPDAHTIGQTLVRTDASATTVHGQFGTVDDGLYPEQAGDVQYINIETVQIERLFVQLRYSKNSQLSTPILIYIDDETLPRAAIYPANQGSWEQFSWTEPILLGSIDEGTHTIIFFTEGQQYGVADLDKF
ncbi:MAG: hypothetical protein GY943_01085, partial [Chloroflexi bacterium]|nr:hypothetical protein [Chloroflexota bacterium]